jgi:hypothetical protein
MNKLANKMHIIPNPMVVARENLIKNMPVITLSIPRKSNAMPSKNTSVIVVIAGLKIMIIDKIIMRAPKPI